MKLYKKIISGIVLLTLALAIYRLLTVTDNSLLIHDSLLFIYSAFVFFVALCYRISLIGREKIKWASLAVSLLIIASITAMQLDKSLIYSLWDITMVGFVLIIGEAIFQIIPKRKALTNITKIAVGLLIAGLTIILAFSIETTIVFFFIELLLFATSLLLLVNFFLKPKKA